MRKKEATNSLYSFPSLTFFDEDCFVDAVLDWAKKKAGTRRKSMLLCLSQVRVSNQVLYIVSI